MCKNAIGSDRNHFADGMNTSILFMLGMVFTVLFGFLTVVWFSYRTARRRERNGAPYAPAGKLRWTPDEPRS